MTRTPTIGEGMPLDVEKLIESRMLIQANSGAGKSWLVRRVLEQTFGIAQHLVIDPEGEFHTLRERHDYLLAGPRGDTPADPRSAAMLARKLLELGASAIIDIYELGARRQAFVKAFVSALVEAPRDLWHQVLVVVDEAHLFAPQEGYAESSDAITDLMTRGRKRGFAGVLATQRISSLKKSAAAECNNKLIGRTALDVDLDRACSELGFPKKGDQREALKRLKPGQFYGYGPALTAEVTLVQVGPVATTHPRAGARVMAPTPPRAKVQKVLAQLGDLPKEAEAELKTIAEYRARVKQLEGDIDRFNRSEVLVAALPKVIEKRILSDADLKRIEAFVEKMTRNGEALDNMRDRLAQAQQVVTSQLGNLVDELRGPKPTPVHATATSVGHEIVREVIEQNRARKPVSVRVAGGDVAITPAHIRILTSLLWWSKAGLATVSHKRVAYIAGYTENGHFRNLKGALSTQGHIGYAGPGAMHLTESGREIAVTAAPSNQVGAPLTRDTLHRAALERVTDAHARILKPLLAIYPNSMSTVECAEAAGYTENGHFRNLKGKLSTLDMVEYPSPGRIRASELLFPEGLR